VTCQIEFDKFVVFVVVDPQFNAFDTQPAFILIESFRHSVLYVSLYNLTSNLLLPSNALRDKQCKQLKLEDRFEILSLVGTLGADSSCHLHMSLGDSRGQVVGGHLMGDAVVFTTAEILLIEVPSLEWTREFDQTTGFDELRVCDRQTAAQATAQ
jgi:hypothetical protein